MTSKFNKRVLASAIAAAVLIPGMASAARIDYPTDTQITFAKDLFPRETSSITTPAGFTLIGVEHVDNVGLTNVAATDTLRITVTLDNNAKFNANAETAQSLAAKIIIGNQLAGVGALGPAGFTQAYYSSGDGELIVEFPAGGAGAAVFTAGSYAVQFPAMQIINLIQGLRVNSAVNAEVTVSNVTKNAKVLGSRRVLARSTWGEEVEFKANTDTGVSSGKPAKYIDVVGCDLATDTYQRRTRFGGEEPGSACGVAGNKVFRLGDINISITKARAEGSFPAAGSRPEEFVLNTNGVASWSLVAPTKLTYTIKGETLPSNMWLDRSQNCTKATDAYLPLNLNQARTEAVAVYNMAAVTDAAWIAHFAGVMTPVDGGTTLYVCAGTNAAGNEELFEQDISAQVDVEHVLNTQYVNPEAFKGGLAPLRYNAGLMFFQNVNPADTPTAQSFLRLTNNNTFDCPVTIDAKDDAGRHSGFVKLTIAAHASEQLNVNVLETGVDPRNRVSGSFGDGTGKWYVRVSPDCNNFVGSALNRNNNTGTVTDLTPEKYIGRTWRTPSVKIKP